MKSFCTKIIMLLVALTVTTSVSSQDLKNVLNKVKGALGSNAGQTVSAVIDNVIGTSKVSEKSLAGTWNYSQPAVAFESENALTNIGGSVASSKIEAKLSSIFSKVGITKGKFSITFATDGTFTTTIKSKKIKGVYTLNGATITFAKSANAKTKINANVKLGTTLQITFKADKLLQFAQQFGSIAGAASTTLSTITGLAKKYKGMQLGMRYTK